MTSGGNNFIDFLHQWVVKLSHGGLHPWRGSASKPHQGGCQLEPEGVYIPPRGDLHKSVVCFVFTSVPKSGKETTIGLLLSS